MPRRHRAGAGHDAPQVQGQQRLGRAATLIDADDNVIEENDFSHTSNTCIWTRTACRNLIRKNNLSYGIRIAPGEVHARDSAGMLIEAGSDDNRFLDNDVTYGGDGVFVRAMGSWTSRGNLFEGNDASYAHNNCFEAQSPGNTYRRNKANYGSHGIWVGLSDETIIEDNEVSHNGDPSGNHNAPIALPAATFEPRAGSGGITILGQTSHTVCRGNKCIGNNGPGIVLWGDTDNPQKRSTIGSSRTTSSARIAWESTCRGWIGPTWAAMSWTTGKIT